MKIKSVTDIITNSSSETFIIHYPGITRKELLHDLEEARRGFGEEEVSSGMGGILEVSNLETWSGNYYTTNPRIFYSEFRIPMIQDTLIINIDWALKKTIKYLQENYPKAYDESEDLYPIYDEEGKELLRMTKDYNEWMSLPDPLQRHGAWVISEIDWWNYEDRY